MKTTTDRVVAKILKTKMKDKTILISWEGKLHKASACQSKSKTGVRLNRFLRLRRFINKK
jgi:hypothetical protein